MAETHLLNTFRYLYTQYPYKVTANHAQNVLDELPEPILSFLRGLSWKEFSCLWDEADKRHVVPLFEIMSAYSAVYRRYNN